MRRTLAAIANILLLTITAGVPKGHASGLLQDGNIVVPGDGCLLKFSPTNPTQWLTSNAFGRVYDAMEDPQGRIVFLAGAGRSTNSSALFRADPATGVLERLIVLEYIPLPGDTLPYGLTGGFYGVAQSLHTETKYQMTIDDQANGGVPQVSTGESYAFSIGGAIGGALHGVSIRWLVDRGKAEQGLDVSGCNSSYGVAMAADGSSVYYAGTDRVFRAGPQLGLSAHLTVPGVGTVDADLQITPSNDLIYDNPILDDTNIPNVSATCGSVTDNDVPMVGGGFAPFSALTIGVRNGSLYATTNCGCSGTPYEFNLAPRGPFLNPNICLYYKAVKFQGGIPWYLGDTMAVTPDRGESADGSSVLANADGNILSVSPGSVSHLGRNGAYTGRPLRWHAPSTLLASGATPAAVQSDTSLGAVVFRVDSLVTVMVTAPNGQRIGVTAADSVVNDFGASGQVTEIGPSHWPKLVTIMGPVSGNYFVDVTGARSGPFGVTGYLAETSIGGAKSSITGSISSGETQRRVLQVTAPLTLTWLPATAGVTEPRAATAFGIDWVGPVPATSAVSFACRAPEAGAVRLEVFDLSGRRVATLGEGVTSAGRFNLFWSGRDDNGSRLAAGVYLARLSMHGASATRRIVLAR